MKDAPGTRDYDWLLLAILAAICALRVIEIYSATHGSTLSGMHMKQVRRLARRCAPTWDWPWGGATRWWVALFGRVRKGAVRRRFRRRGFCWWARLSSPPVTADAASRISGNELLLSCTLKRTRKAPAIS